MRRSSILAFVVLTLASARASAEDPERMYRDCTRVGAWDATGAADCLRRLVAAHPMPKAKLALALLERDRGRFLAARALIAEVRASGDKELRKWATDEAEKLEREMPRVVLKLPEGTSAVEVSIDGVAVADDPAGIAADAGQHKVEVRANGKTFVAEVVTARGEKVRVEVTWPKDAPPVVSSSAPPPPVVSAPPVVTSTPPLPPLSERRRPTGALVVAGAGAALVVVGGVVAYLGFKKADGAATDATACDARPAGCPRAEQGALIDDYRAGDRTLKLGYGVLGLGVAAVAGGALWWTLGGRDGTTSAGVGGQGLAVRTRF